MSGAPSVILFFSAFNVSWVLFSFAATSVQGYATAQNPSSARSLVDKFCAKPPSMTSNSQYHL